MSEYDAADSQIKTGVMAREAAAELEEAIMALEVAAEQAFDDEEEIREIVKTLREMQERYNSIGEAL